jgi:hypothetical protein
MPDRLMLMSRRRYQKFMIMDTMKNVPNFRSCLRPNCPSSQIHEGGDAEPLMVCAACGYKMCYPHALPWHEGQTCTQYDVMRRHRTEDDASLALIASLSKRCPGESCGVPIQKNLGCDHMTCKPTQSAMPAKSVSKFAL